MSNCLSLMDLDENKPIITINSPGSDGGSSENSDADNSARG